MAYAGFIAALAGHAPAPALIVLALLLGGSLPPVGSVTRSGWPILVPAAELPAAFALDAVINEIASIFGPLLAALVIVSVPPPAALALAAVAVCVGSLGLPRRVLAPRRASTSRRRRRPPWALAAIALCSSSTAGAAVVGASAAATSLGRTGAAGVLLAVLGAAHGPRDALTQLLVSESTPAEHRTEAFSWLGTAGLGGFGLGSAIAGQATGGPDWQAGSS